MKYMYPFTDYAWKKIFGEEESLPILLAFVNDVIENKHTPFVSLRFAKNEHLGVTVEDRSVVFDLYAENQIGEKFIIELQKSYQKHFRQRTLFYSSFAIQDQAKKGEWDFSLKKVYCISVLDFLFEPEQEKYKHTIKLVDIDTKQVFQDDLEFIYLEATKFNKTKENLTTPTDKWMYWLTQLVNITAEPESFADEMTRKLLHRAVLPDADSPEYLNYQGSLAYYRDLKNVKDTAFEEGQIDGKRLLAFEIAERMKLAGESIERILLFTGLSADDLE